MYNVLKFRKNDEIMSKNQVTGTATQPQRNRKCCQFNKDQYCIITIGRIGIKCSDNCHLILDLDFLIGRHYVQKCIRNHSNLSLVKYVQ